jgi:hypothetical protein
MTAERGSHVAYLVQPAPDVPLHMVREAVRRHALAEGWIVLDVTLSPDPEGLRADVWVAQRLSADSRIGVRA